MEREAFSQCHKLTMLMMDEVKLRHESELAFLAGTP